MEIGYIGLGHMGRPLACQLLAKGALRVYDRSPAAMEVLRDKGASPSQSAADLAREVDVLFTCLPTTADLQGLLFGREGIAPLLRKGAILIDQTSGDRNAALDLFNRLAQQGVALVDAPVSGGPARAEAGSVALLVGAEPALFARIAPLLAGISPNVFHAGGFGCGYVAKAANNLIYSAHRLITFEAMAMAASCGVEPQVMAEILSTGSAQSGFIDTVMRDKILKGILASGFTLGLAQKDVRLATSFGAAAGMPMPLGSLIAELYQAQICRLGAGAQVNETLRLYEEQARVSIAPVPVPVPASEPS